MLTLTPNRRLAAFWLDNYNRSKIKQQQQAWETPIIMPIEAWFGQLWQLLIENSQETPKLVLNKTQQQLLWEKIIQTSDVGVELLRIAATAKNCLQAWKFLRQWQVTNAKLLAYANHSVDTNAFCVWLQEYLKWLNQNNHLDFDLMIDHLITQHSVFIHMLPKKIRLLGVDELNPQYAKLISTLADNGIEIVHASMVEPAASVGQISFLNEDAELNAAARWAKDQIEKHPDDIIAVVVPELERKRQVVQRIFARQIAPEHMNISAPLALSDYALIDSALLILQLAKPVINYSDISILLRNSFIKDAESEAHVRAKIDSALRTRSEAKLTWKRLQTNPILENTIFKQLLDNFIIKLPNFSTQQTASAWVRHIQVLLESWGWPGKLALTRQQMHLYTCWQNIMHEYCQLSLIYGKHTYSQALQIIQRLTNDTPFLPAETGQTKLHVLGVLEASGIAFDRLWVTGMDRSSWPPDAAPNPFIPSEIQRDLDMPRSSPTRELKVARRLTETLKQGGKQGVLFSYPLSRDDQITSGSNLLAAIQHVTIPFKASQPKPNQTLDLERISDNVAPAYEASQTKGGSQVFKLQAECPFRAFAILRLDAQPLQEPQLILTAAQRGQIVHSVLEEFWRACKSHAQLAAWLPHTANTILHDIISKILQTQQRYLPFTLTDNYIELEQQRLQRLLIRWLQYEFLRAPFVVHSLEEKLTVTFGPLSVSIKLDRIDQLANNQYVVIDYKTGNNQISNWFTQPILEPQLPMYALSLQQEVVGVVIANLQAQVDQLKFWGVVANTELLPDAKLFSELPDQLTIWRNSLSQTAQDFVRGVADAQPSSAQVCQRCHLQALCRIYDN